VRGDYIVLILLGLSNFAYPQIDLPSSWQSRLHLGHDLVGQIWSSASQDFVSIPDFVNSIEDSKYLILGEKHDNPDHHALQLSVLNHLLDLDKVSLVSFEMMDTSSQNLIDGLHQAEIDNLESLKEYLEWDDEGWDWPFYGPLIYASYISGVRIAASNITTSRMMEIYGLEELPSELDIFDDLTKKRLIQDIDESHCGLLPESQFPAMVRVQQGRDYSMATSLVSEREKQIKVLIAGNYHSRKDLGVPRYLIASDPELSDSEIVSVSFMEVAQGETDPKMYSQATGNVTPFDFLWFTPVVSEEDYCSSLREQ
tara:strand:- start:1379 stop:2314 length:936 start_codon:yes stop_codon:yes gene_type:complete